MNNAKQWFTGEVITADELNRIEGRITDADGKMYRPNLLINSDFRNPINQRGQSSYIGASGGKYSIDRWSINSGAISMSVNNGSITLTNNQSYASTVKQVFENALPLDTYTVSINVKSVSGSPYIQLNGSISSGVLVEGSNTFTFENIEVSSLVIAVTSNTTLELEYIKLEQGSIATPFTPRPYAEELAICQRYGCPMPTVYNTDFLVAHKVVGRGLAIELFLPQALRTKPTITGSFEVFDGSYFQSVPISEVECNGNVVVLTFSTSIANGSHLINCNNGFIDSEIY